MGEHVAEKLADLGLSNYEAQAFQALIEKGPMTADEVAAAAELPKGRIYDVLNSLSKRSVVRHDDSRPRTYVPASPEHAVSQLLDARLEDLDERRRRFETTAEELETAIRSQETDRPTQSFATSAFRHEDAIELLDERLGTATECVSIAAGTIDEGPETRDTLTERLRSLLHDGITVKLLVHEHTELEYDTELADAGLAIRRSPVVPDQRFILIDGEEVCLEVVHPITPNELLSVVDFRSDQVATELVDTFDELWADATPAEP
ncbi:TrmB family transcriptional regulator [Natranaeroarchaeum sulfidigenes]|uniref:Sugar-specific transcriptional regulator TrmB n=1 Tax=Natranaeroarchaeum sulfidigenes TaxID=2784880 RepID=A0A897ML31_9EURY|nr:helix-turn-helix domain-containing protein [Natranaeroarchaeum sulfidigenes]QSG01277.1 Sugar-specific transcriptional regulator TrmB [Natranaeroarchaeum sulfidigenes]